MVEYGRIFVWQDLEQAKFEALKCYTWLLPGCIGDDRGTKDVERILHNNGSTAGMNAQKFRHTAHLFLAVAAHPYHKHIRISALQQDESCIACSQSHCNKYRYTENNTDYQIQIIYD